MSLKQIETELNKRFADYNDFSKRNIIFWYDKDGQYKDEIDNIHLFNVKVQKLTRTNSLQTKYKIEYEDKESNYLIYAPFEKPDDANNHLADMFYYSRYFSTDRATAICEECKISNTYIPFLKRFPNFFNTDNESRFKEFCSQIDPLYINEKQLSLIMIASVLNVKDIQPNFNEIVKVLITDKSKDGIPVKFEKIIKAGLEDVFWRNCENEYGCKSETKDFFKFKTALFITYAQTQIKETFPSRYDNYIMPKASNVILLISNIITNIKLQSSFIELSNEIQDSSKIYELIDKFNIYNCLDCYAFEFIDKKIVSTFVNKLLDTKYCLSHGDMAIIANRIKKTCFKQYVPIYKIINRASKLINSIECFLQDINSSYSAKEVIENYITRWNKIDRYYRQFYYNFDNISFDNDCCNFIDLENLFDKLRIFVENIYTNNYLSKLSLLWTDKLEKLDSYNDIPGRKQWTFFDSVANVSAFVHNTIVIISDAFRYECANQLIKEFDVLPEYDTSSSYMVSTIPSYTQLGMAALLPFKNPQIESNGYVSLNGKATNGTDARNNILRETDYKDKALCIQFDELASKTKKEIKTILADKKLVYIYHNQIDARGDKAQSENEVFNACEEAISEIKTLIQKISSSNFKKFIITADHGFIYKRDKLVTSDKISVGHINENDIKNKRYVYTKNGTNINGSIKFNMSYLSETLKDTDVIVPKGVDVFTFPGGGQNYVHGGVSLQEIIIPLVTIKTQVKTNYNKEKQEATLDLVSSFKVISNLNTYLTFIQKEPVTNIIKPKTIKAWFEDKNGKKVSDVRMFTVDKTDTNPEERQYKEKFTFANQRYNSKETYTLKLINADNEFDLKTYDFTIDIPFADDFGFEL